MKACSTGIASKPGETIYHQKANHEQKTIL
jgi:hypothetical protein